MILAANAELTLPAPADLADHLMDTVALTVANVTLPTQHVAQLQLKWQTLETSSWSSMLCNISRAHLHVPFVGTKRNAVPQATVRLHLP